MAGQPRRPREVCGSTQTDRASSHWAQCAGAALHLAWARGPAQEGDRLGQCRCNARARHRASLQTPTGCQYRGALGHNLLVQAGA